MWIKFLSYNSLIVITKLISSFVVSKVTAIYLGPSGYALVGNFKNVIQILQGLTSSGFESGTIRHIAEHSDEKPYLKKVISSVVIFSLILSIFASILLAIFSQNLSEFTFKTTEYAYIFRCLAILLPFISVNFLVLYIINGLQKLKTYAKLVSLVSVTNALLTFGLVYIFKLNGALIAIVSVSVITLFLSLVFKDVRFVLSQVVFSIKQMSLTIIKSMSVYVLMAAYSTVLISVVYLLVRNKIINSYDETIAGYWEAVNKISAFYMMFFTSVFTLYLLPNLSKNKTQNGYKLFMAHYFKRLIPLLLIMFLALFLMRFFVIKLFLTEDFLEIEQYFYLQFIGDFIKIIGFSLACQFHAKRMVIAYFISDAIIYISLYILSFYFIKSFNLVGVFYAHIISCSLYLIAVSLFIFTQNKKYLDVQSK
ncbi:O-antigen translocase [Winogradskyella litorisediminis]|uniref:O-antigen translocase n=1 Tax=Winogradskyella litorisediminis TaxID=1156618 RepID=A0ABW3NAM2_9FLAO